MYVNVILAACPPEFAAGLRAWLEHKPGLPKHRPTGYQSITWLTLLLLLVVVVVVVDGAAVAATTAVSKKL